MAVKCGSCQRTIADDERLIDLALEVRWADEREDWSGTKSFCSFSCVSSWAFEKSVQHDARTMLTVPERFEPHEPVIDTTTDQAVR